jgi:hypothetical protein
LDAVLDRAPGPGIEEAADLERQDTSTLEMSPLSPADEDHTCSARTVWAVSRRIELLDPGRSWLSSGLRTAKKTSHRRRRASLRRDWRIASSQRRA